jgi:hypothetical protein
LQSLTCARWLELETKFADHRFGGESRASGDEKTGFGRVAYYRLYSLDHANMVASAQWLEADDDAKAIEAAKEKMNGQDFELWQRSRLVRRISAGEQRGR